MNQDCIFCKINNGDIPSEKIFEDDKCFIIKDINPQAPTHLLVIPKEHIPTVADVTSENEHMLGHLVNMGKNIAKEKELSGYKLLFNVGKNGGQEVFHIHLHVMGR